MSVEAYSKNGNCKIAKISDTVASISEGGARIVTVAGTKKMAAAMSVNSELMEMNPQWNNKALYYSKKQVCYLFQYLGCQGYLLMLEY